jgi:hypothetical protein
MIGSQDFEKVRIFFFFFFFFFFLKKNVIQIKDHTNVPLICCWAARFLSHTFVTLTVSVFIRKVFFPFFLFSNSCRAINWLFFLVAIL